LEILKNKQKQVVNKVDLKNKATSHEAQLLLSKQKEQILVEK